MAPKVIVTNWVHEAVLDHLRGHCTLVSNPDRDRAMTRNDIVARAADAVAMIGFMPDCVDEALLDAMPRLRLVAGALKGYDNYDVDAMTRRGIALTIVPDLLTVPTAELTIGLMIGLARHVPAGDSLVRSGGFAGWRPVLYGTGLAGATVGVVGMGAIGRALARRLAGFDVTLIYYDTLPLPVDEERRLSARWVGWAEVLATSDVLVLAVPLTPETEGLIDGAALAAMRPGAFLINPARGSLVDEDAVADALESGRLGGYAADVFAFEDWRRAGRPRTVPARLLAARHNTLFTPHLGSAVESVRRDIAMSAARSVVQFLAGETPDGLVNPSAIAVPA